MEVSGLPEGFSLHEQQRLNALFDYHNHLADHDSDIDEIVKLAVEICGTPIGLISFVGENKQYFKSKIGISVNETDRSVSFCSHAIERPGEMMIVGDARKDARFCDNPLVTGDPNIVFYAGMPLVDESGFALGTLCTLDTKPRELDDRQINSLRILSKQVMHLISQRQLNSKLTKEKENLTNSINFISPYYILLDYTDNIISLGINYQKAFAEISSGKPFAHFFSWQSAFNSQKLLDQTDIHNRLLFFESLDKKNKFKCTVKRNDANSYFIFAVPVINTLYPITNYHINITNFPKHDYIAEYLFLQQSATRGLEDSQKLNLLITEKNKKLEEAKNTLIRVNSTLEERINNSVQKIKRLALFPEQNPNPVIEISLDSFDIIYLNPIAKSLFEINDENIQKSKLIQTLKIDKNKLQKGSQERIEIEVNGKIFERNLFYNDQFDSLRLYLHDITQIRLKEREEKTKIALFIKQQESLTNIRKLSDNCTLEEKFRFISKVVAQTIGCNRCSIWLSKNDLTSIITSHVYLLNSDDYAEGMEISYDVAPAYFKALSSKQTILALDATKNEATFEFTDSYLKPLNISSMIDIPLLQGNQSIGVLCCEFFEIQNEFDSDTIAFCNSVADIIVLACETNDLKESQKQLEVKNTLLKENMDQIITMQSEIVEREKLATLGMLIAGIAHEINSPLGAIKASNEYLHKIFTESFLNAIQYISPDVIQAGLSLFAMRNVDSIATTTRDIRKFQKDALNYLEHYFPDTENKSFYANVIIELGLQSDIAKLSEFIIHKQSKEVFLFAQYLIHIFKAVSTVGLAVNRAGSVVKALNTFSHGNIDQELSHFKLHDSFNSVITLLWNKIKYSAYVENNIPQELMISGSADELSQVWTNIINNALQAADNKCKIWIDYTEENEMHRICISNDGPAIPSEIVPKIFDAFFSTKKRGEGTGLGLNIVKKIIEKHQGKIECHSDEKKTRFLIFLPKLIEQFKTI